MFSSFWTRQFRHTSEEQSNFYSPKIAKKDLKLPEHTAGVNLLLNISAEE